MVGRVFEKRKSAQLDITQFRMVHSAFPSFKQPVASSQYQDDLGQYVYSFVTDRTIDHKWTDIRVQIWSLERSVLMKRATDFPFQFEHFTPSWIQCLSLPLERLPDTSKEVEYYRFDRTHGLFFCWLHLYLIFFNLTNARSEQSCDF